MSSQTDEEIAEQVQKGDAQVFGLLVERYEQKMIRYARRFLFGHHDAEDLVQEVFIKAYTNIQGFNTKRKFSSWLYRIAHNEFINAIKKNSHFPLLSFDIDSLFPHPQAKEEADRQVNQKDLRETLDKCLGELEDKYREPLVLYYWEELSYQEIAEIMHLPVSTVGVRISRGRKQMQRIYNQLNYEHE